MSILKICGVSDEDAIDALRLAGASHAGFVFHPKSPRYIKPDKAASLAKKLRDHTPPLQIVALVADPDLVQLAQIMTCLAPDCVQFHGRETPAKLSEYRAAMPGGVEIWKALGIGHEHDLIKAHAYSGIADRILFDARPPKEAAYGGGHGRAFDWTLLQKVRGDVPWLLAGGLTMDTVDAAIDAVRDLPGFSGVDVSSGVESAPGQKDPEAIKAFIATARRAMNGA